MGVVFKGSNMKLIGSRLVNFEKIFVTCDIIILKAEAFVGKDASTHAS